MTDFCEGRTRDDSVKDDDYEEMSSVNNDYRDEVVMDSVGEVDFDSDDYTESDDESNAIAEGWK